MTDIDIDFLDREPALQVLRHIPASNVVHNELVRHPTGIYVQAIPIDPITGYAALDYTEAERYGYFKIDFLNNRIYAGVRDEPHLDDLLAREPMWELLQSREIVEQLAHIHDHFAIIDEIQPQSVEDLAIVLALIRPGKRYLCGQPRAIIEQEIWKSGEGYYFKKSHAISYALAIVVQLNLLVDSVSADE